MHQILIYLVQATKYYDVPIQKGLTENMDDLGELLLFLKWFQSKFESKMEKYLVESEWLIKFVDHNNVYLYKLKCIEINFFPDIKTHIDPCSRLLLPFSLNLFGSPMNQMDFAFANFSGPYLPSRSLILSIFYLSAYRSILEHSWIPEVLEDLLADLFRSLLALFCNFVSWYYVSVILRHLTCWF